MSTLNYLIQYYNGISCKKKKALAKKKGRNKIFLFTIFVKLYDANERYQNGPK